MKLDKSQIIPFPLPEHLSLFVSQQLDTPIETISENLQAKALHIQRKRPLGKLILRCLKKTDKPVLVNDGFTLYISVSKNSRINDKKITECRFSFVTLDEDEIADIVDIFDTLFRTALVSYVDGARFGNNFKKGKMFAAIVQFLQKYNLAHDDLAVESFRQMYNREKKADKHLISRYI